jgi:hypothetical protein
MWTRHAILCALRLAPVVVAGLTVVPTDGRTSCFTDDAETPAKKKEKTYVSNSNE